MQLKTTENAYAKINLMLDITGIREDGYHLIDGVMQTVSLADRLEVEFEVDKATRIEIRIVNGKENIPADSSNLACRAASAYLGRICKTGIVKIQLRKEIPVAAGLAGGSADAAAVLRALNRLFGYPIGTEELCAVGAKLGADVPFCVRGGAMRTEGIGEKLTPCAGLPECFLVILHRDDLPFSTPRMYAELDRVHNRFSNHPNSAEKVEKLIQVLRKGDLSAICERMGNVFEEPAILLSNGRIEELKSLLMRQPGMMGALMSGSGSAVFGIFAKEEDAQIACDVLKQQPGINAWLCNPISKEFCVC
ncbi:MAG: 4-(cytidine 5'-diphospho)-2-C-methyl-D-erythritol kinase [Ruminococcaceae bacterium]|nr:4-(cytidine 5'-diphospho)-2-C-methyl-D-erythritol kinase [Oscillospiraceae bacterium]